MRVKAWTILIKLCEQPRAHHSNLKLWRWKVEWSKGQSIERWSGRWIWNDINQQKWTLGIGFKRKTPKGLAKWGWGSGACILNGMHLNWEIKFVGVKVSNAWCREPCPKMLNYVNMVNDICWLVQHLIPMHGGWGCLKETWTWNQILKWNGVAQWDNNTKGCNMREVLSHHDGWCKWTRKMFKILQMLKLKNPLHK